VAATFAFDAYGNPVDPDHSSKGEDSSRGGGRRVDTPFRFAGQYLDSESGLYYMRARYYDPRSAQFVSRDPLNAASREPYAYVADDPVNAIDPTGMQAGLALCGLLPVPGVGEAACGVGIGITVGQVVIAGIGLGVAVVGGIVVAKASAPASTRAKAGAQSTPANPDPCGCGPKVTGDELKALRSQFDNVTKPGYWRAEAARGTDGWSAEQLADMKAGRAPIGPDGKSLNLHHIIPLSRGGTNDFSNLLPLTRTYHFGNFRVLHPCLFDPSEDDPG
jgi:RHS repeat-associated protein